MEFDRPRERSPEKDCLLGLTFLHPEGKSLQTVFLRTPFTRTIEILGRMYPLGSNHFPVKIFHT